MPRTGAATSSCRDRSTTWRPAFRPKTGPATHWCSPSTSLTRRRPPKANALALLNQLCALPIESVAPALAGPITRDLILQERRFELTGEAKRRQDLIRHGKYTLAWGYKPASAAFRMLLPIPQNQMDANPLLTQNPGY